MLSLRRLATSTSRARPASSLTASTFTLSRQSRPQNLSELRKFESLLQLRWNSTDYGSQDSRDMQDDRSSSNLFRKTRPMRRELRGHPTEPTKVIYVGNLKYEVTEEEIREKFEQYGRIVGVRIPRTIETGVARGFAYVEFGEIAEAAEAIEACHQAPFGGRRLNCQYVHRTDFRIRENPESKTLFIGNMSFDTSEEDLAELFKDITGCIDVRVAVDHRTGQPRGFVHADFADVESAVNAKEKLSGVQLYGRKIRVDYSTPPEDRKQAAASQQAQRQRTQSFEELMEKRQISTSEEQSSNDESTESEIAEIHEDNVEGEEAQPTEKST